MLNRLLALLLGVVFFANTSPASTFSVPEADADRLVYVYGVIGGGSALAMAGRLEKLSEDPTRPIYMVINSPGGEVLTGLQIVSGMQLAKSRGVQIKCMVGMLAASMASIIYDECTERSAFSQSLLLWHSIATQLGGGFMSPGIRVTPDVANTLAFSLETLQQDIPARLRSHLGFDEKTWHYLFDGENFITAGWLHSQYNPHYAGIVDDVSGVSNVFSLKAPAAKGAPVDPDDKTKKIDPAKKTEIPSYFPEGPAWVPTTFEYDQMDPKDAADLREFLKNHPNLQ